MNGALPSGWRLGTLADVIASISTGVSVNGEDRSVREGEVGVLKITAVLRGVFEPEHHKAVVGPERNRLTTRVSAGTILVSRGNGNPAFVGAAALVTEGYPNLYLPDLLWQVTPSRYASPEWLGLVLGSTLMRPHIARIAVSTSTLKKISQSQYLTIPIVIPPRHEQDRIVEIVQTWDRGILVAEALRATVSTMLTAYLRQHLHHPDGAASAPKAWRRASFGSVGRVVAGGTPSTSAPELWGGGIPWITPAEITKLSTRYADATERTLTDAGLRASAAEVLPAGSLIVCTRASVGEMAINTVQMATNQGFKSIVPDADVSVDFLYYYLRANGHLLVRVAAGSTFSEVSKTAFEGIPIALPEMRQQCRIAGLLGALDDEIALLSAFMAQLQLQRRWLMAKLLSGKVTVSACEREVEAAYA